MHTNCVKHNVPKILGNLRCCVKKQYRYDTKLRRLIPTFGKRGQETERTGRSPLRGRRSALDCSAIEEEGKEEEESQVLSPCLGYMHSRRHI
jgi:hypothetical protein